MKNLLYENWRENRNKFYLHQLFPKIALFIILKNSKASLCSLCESATI